MKIYIDEKLVYDLNEDKIDVLKAYLQEDSITEEIERRVVDSIENKYQACLNRLKLEWEPKLVEKGVQMIPTSKEDFAKLVFRQPTYKTRSEQELDKKKYLGL